MHPFQHCTTTAYLTFIFALNALCGCDHFAKRAATPDNPQSESLVSPSKTDGSTKNEPTAETTKKSPVSPSETDGSTKNEATAETTKKTGPGESTRFDADYEKWKLRAVEEFPEIGVAGSRFNQQFLLEAKRLRESNAPELAHPNWPYLLALQVNTILEKSKASSPPSISEPEGTKAAVDIRKQAPRQQDPTEQPESTDRFGFYSVTDLTKMKSLPKGGVFKGTITKVEKQIAAGDLDIVMVLDGLLQCEINLDRNTKATRGSNGFYHPFHYYSGSSRNSTTLEVVQDHNSLKLVEKQSASMRSAYTGKTYTQTNRADLLTLAVGQTVSVEGMLLLKANKKPFLKGIIRED